MKLRPLLPDDAQVLRDFAVMTYRRAYQGSLADDEIDLRIADKHRPEGFRTLLEDPSHVFFGLFDGDTLLGFFHMSFSSRSETCSTEGLAEIVRFYVHPDHQGQSLGRQLMNQAQQTCLAAGFRGLWLHNFDQNIGGILFYQKMGFRIEGRDPFEIVPGRVRFDFVFTKRFEHARQEVASI